MGEEFSRLEIPRVRIGEIASSEFGASLGIGGILNSGIGGFW